VLGLQDGFEWLIQGNVDHVVPLTIKAVSRLHFRGDSFIGISHANPTRDPQHIENTVQSLLRLNIAKLITIGGDDTAFSAMQLPERTAGRIKVVHVPKTINNDLGPPFADVQVFIDSRCVAGERFNRLRKNSVR
jgi:ATP-dependent phosphofructokinase / diphosphate-dependent phosphofructokinase